MRHHTQVAVCVLQVSVAIAAFSQHQLDFSGKRSITVRTETVLSGINLYDTQPQHAIERLGKPTRVTEDAGTGTSELEWEQDACSLILHTRGRWIDVIEVRGSNSGCEFGRTGRGLRLGARVGDVARVYPIRYTLGLILPGRPRDCPAHPTLLLDVSDSGTIDHMTLSDGSVCY